MNKTLFAILTLLISSTAFGQSFEGKLTYKVEFDIKTQKMGGFEIKKEQVIEKMKSEGEYFDTIVVTIKDGNYIKEINSSSKKKIIYKSELNKIFTLQNNFEYVVITDASKYNSMNIKTEEPKINKNDSTVNVNGNECQLLKLSWGKLGEEYYFFNSNVAKVNPVLFRNHNYEYFNEILKVTNSYPLQIVKTINNFISIKMILVAISEEKVSDSVFKLPELENAEKNYYDMMLKMTGSEVMKIKN